MSTERVQRFLDYVQSSQNATAALVREHDDLVKNIAAAKTQGDTQTVNALKHRYFSEIQPAMKLLLETNLKYDQRMSDDIANSENSRPKMGKA